MSVVSAAWKKAQSISKPSNICNLSTTNFDLIFQANNTTMTGTVKCDNLVTSQNIPYVTRTYVDQAMGIGDKYFAHEHQQQLREVLRNVSDEDAEKILQKLFFEITNPNGDFHLTKETEAALIAINIENS